MTVVRWGLALSGWVAVAATALPAAHPVRVLAATLFLVACPGFAAVRAAAPRTRGRSARTWMPEALQGVALSLTLATLVAVTLFLAGAFTARTALTALAVLTSILALLPGRPIPSAPV
jgi:hypothetical protein